MELKTGASASAATRRTFQSWGASWCNPGHPGASGAFLQRIAGPTPSQTRFITCRTVLGEMKVEVVAPHWLSRRTRQITCERPSSPASCPLCGRDEGSRKGCVPCAPCVVVDDLNRHTSERIVGRMSHTGRGGRALSNSFLVSRWQSLFYICPTGEPVSHGPTTLGTTRICVHISRASTRRNKRKQKEKKEQSRR